MRFRSWYLLPAGLLLALWLAITAPTTEAIRVACATVVSEVHREISSTKEANVDISKVAKHLGTTVAWTEQCMRTYGLRPKRPGHESAESREAELESFEEDEPEETGPEDNEEPGAPDLKEHPDRQRLLKIHPPPTPPEGQEIRQGFDEGYR
jgi:hypothetical protein